MPLESSQTKKHPRFVTLCGRIFRDTDPAYFPRVEYRGRTIYLCTESCLGAFLDDLAASGYEGAVTLEIDLRRYLTDAQRLQAMMVSMREDVERRLAGPGVRREAG